MKASRFAVIVVLILMLCPMLFAYAAPAGGNVQNPFTAGSQQEFKDDPANATPEEAALIPARELATSMGLKIAAMYVIHRPNPLTVNSYKSVNGKNVIDYKVPYVIFGANKNEDVMWNNYEATNTKKAVVKIYGPYPDKEKAEAYKNDRELKKGPPISGYETYRQFVPFAEGRGEVTVEGINPDTGEQEDHTIIDVNTPSSLRLKLAPGNNYVVEIYVDYGFFYPASEAEVTNVAESLAKAVLSGMEKQGLLKGDGKTGSSGNKTDDIKGGKPGKLVNIGQVPGPEDMKKMLTGIIGPGLVSIFLTLLTNIKPPVAPLPQSLPPPAPGYPVHVEKRTLRRYDGSTVEVEFDSKTGLWINKESGTYVDIDRWDEAQRDAAINKELSRIEAERMGRRETSFDREMDSMAKRQQEQAKMLQNLQQMEKKVLFGSSEAKSLYENRGGPGDIIANIRELKENLVSSSEFEETKKAYDKVKNVYCDRITGKTMSHRDLPSDAEMLRGTLADAADNTFREIATGGSYKAMALRALTSYMTGGASEYGFVAANSLYGMKDYVDKGGDSAFEAFKEQVKQVMVDEITDRITGKAMDSAISAGGKVVDEVMDQVKEKLKDWKKVTFEARKTSYMDGLKKSFEKADVDSVSIMKDAKKAAAEDLELNARNEIFKKGRDSGRNKVSELDSARSKLEQTPNSPEAIAEFNKAVEKVQMDKHAMQQLNTLKGAEGENVRKAFNKRMAYVYDESLEKARRRIAKEYGVPVEDVKIVNPTNVKGGNIPEADPMGFAKGKKMTTSGDDIVDYTPKVDEANISGKKASFDKDVTVRVKQKTINPRTGEAVEGFVDVPRNETKRVYNEEFYKANHSGELPKKPDGNIDTKAVDEYAKKMDQATTDRVDAEAYGIGDEDLQTSTVDAARGRDLKDVEAVSKTMEYKANEWANRADEARDLAKKAAADGDYSKASELLEEAEGFMEESMRQTTKQYDNMVVNRIIKANEAAGFPDVPVANIPPELQKGIAIMKNVGKSGGLTVAEAEKALEMMNLSPQKVAQMSSAVVESLQKFSK